jgi:hypothetical protein
MLNPDDRRAIEGLFDRLAEVERRGTARDPEAEALIRAEIARQPWAPYYMAQTVLVQEQALKMAEERISELEAQLRRRPNDFLGGLFGGREAPQQPRTPARRERGPWDRDERQADNRGGFLAGAAQTALGVTGGLLLGSAIASMLGAGAAHAGEAGADQDADQQDNDAGQQDNDNGDPGDNDFGGDDLGDGGGFDFGGDF